MNSFPCKQCPEVFTNPMRRQKHHQAVHPKPQREPQPWPEKEHRPSLKRETDRWPSRA